MEEYKITFKNPYLFEGKEYKDIDLTGIESLTTKDLIDADKQFNASGQMAIMNEMTIGYACIVAAKGSNQPVEFFQNLPAAEGLKVKNKVMNFLNE